jgi:hypothetical protein
MPAYNAQDTIIDAINSALAQTCDVSRSWSLMMARRMRRPASLQKALETECVCCARAEGGN